jgi:chitodextrinase
MKTHYLLLSVRPYAAVLLILVLFTAGSRWQYTAARADSAPSALVRIEFSSQADLQRVAATAVHPLSLLTASSGENFLLALAGPDQQNALLDQGYSLSVLDYDGRGAAYYLAHATPGRSLQAAGSRVNILFEDEAEAIIRAVPEEAEQLPELGIRITRLGPEAIVLPLAPIAPVIPTSITPHPAIAAMIDQVQSEDLFWLMEKLTGETAAMIGGSPYTITSRYTYSGTPIQKATQFVSEYFQSLDLDVEMHNWSNPNYPNVIATIPGLSQSEQIVLITAHMDSMPSGPLAPGADDNASGTTAVMIAADILSQFQWDCTVRFVAFTGEEQGLLGSKAYALRSYNLGENIAGVLNLDMIAYNSDTYPIVDLHARSWLPGSVAMANLFSQVVTTYDIALTPDILIDQSLGNYSDNKSFWDRGYSAILGIEDYNDFTPYYHTVNDRLNTLDMAYFTNFVKASVGTFAHMGCLIPPPGWLVGTVSDNYSGLPLAGATIEATANGSAGSTTSGADGSYSLALEEGTYEVTVQADGYAPWAAPPVLVSSYVTIPFDVALEPLYSITGTLRDAFTGQPIYGQVGLSDLSIPPVDSDPESGSYTLVAPAGTYTLTATAAPYQAQAHLVNLDGNLQHDFDLEPVCLLVVDGAGEPAYADYYTSALDRLALSYTAVDQLPDLESVAFYRGVVWFTGDRQSGGLKPADLETTAAYLAGGGRLFLSGQYLGQEIGYTDFYSDYLRAEHLTGSTESRSLVGQEFLDGHNLVISGGDGAGNQAAPGLINPGPGASAVLHYAGTPHSGGVAYSGLHRAVTFAFGYEAINEQPERDQVMAAVVDYLGSCQPPAAPQAAFTSEPLPQHGRVRFSNSSQGTALMSYTWDFGDGLSASTAHSEHAYPAPGLYTTTLTVTNAYGADSAVLPVTVEPLGPLSMHFEPVLPWVAEPITFTAGIVTPYSVAYTWDFGDAGTAVGPVVTHAYAAAGMYTVTVTATSALETLTTTTTVVVNEPELPVPEWRFYLPITIKP